MKQRGTLALKVCADCGRVRWTFEITCSDCEGPYGGTLVETAVQPQPPPYVIINGTTRPTSDYNVLGGNQ